MDPRIQQIYAQRAMMSGGCTQPGIFGGYSQGGYLQGGAQRKQVIKIHPGDKTVQVGNTLVVSHPSSETKVKAIRKKKTRTLEQQIIDEGKKAAAAEKRLLTLTIKQANKPVRAMYDVPDVITACDAASVQYATAMGKEVPKAVQRRLELASKHPGMTYGPAISPAQLQKYSAYAAADPDISAAQAKALAALAAANKAAETGEVIQEMMEGLSGTGLLGGARKRKVIVRPGRVVSVKCVKTKQYAAAKKKTQAKRVARKKK